MCIYICREYYSVILFIKKNEMPPFVTTGMDLEGIMLSKVSQTEEDKYWMISLIYRILKKTKNNNNPRS